MTTRPTSPTDEPDDDLGGDTDLAPVARSSGRDTMPMMIMREDDLAPDPEPLAPAGPALAAGGPGKVALTGVRRQPGFRYFIKDGDVWAVSTRAEGTTTEVRVARAGLPPEDPQFVYYLDPDGDVARRGGRDE